MIKRIIIFCKIFLNPKCSYEHVECSLNNLAEKFMPEGRKISLSMSESDEIFLKVFFQSVSMDT